MIKAIFTAIATSYRYPQAIFGLHQLPWKAFRRFSHIIIMFITMTSMLTALPFINHFHADVAASRATLPDFSVVDGQLQLADGQKPVYYQSPTFQLVIDDTVTTAGPDDSPSIPTDVANRLSTSPVTGLFFFKNQAFARVSDRLMSLTPFYTDPNGPLTTQGLSDFLGTIADASWISMITLFVVAWIVAYLSYWFFILIVGYVAHFSVLRSGSLQLFSQTLRLVIQITFLPLVVYHFVRFFLAVPLPMNFLFHFFLGLFTLGFIFYAQQRFMMAMFETFAKSDFEESFKQLDEQIDEANMTPDEIHERLNALLQEARAQIKAHQDGQDQAEDESGDELGDADAAQTPAPADQLDHQGTADTASSEPTNPIASDQESDDSDSHH